MRQTTLERFIPKEVSMGTLRIAIDGEMSQQASDDIKDLLIGQGYTIKKIHYGKLFNDKVGSALLIMYEPQK